MNEPPGQWLTVVATDHPISLEEGIDPLGKRSRFLAEVFQDRVRKQVGESIEICDSDLHLHADPVVFDEDLRDGRRCHRFGHHDGVTECVQRQHADTYQADQDDLSGKPFHSC